MYFSKKLKRFKNINHCFFSKNGGFSKGIYKSLNCGQGSSDSKSNINKNLNLFKSDITNKKILHKIFKEKKIEICFHLAAQVEVGKANQDPFSTFETNIKGTYSLLEVIRTIKKHNKRFVLI